MNKEINDATMLELKKGDIVKHFKGNNLIEKNIYEIIAVNPEYTGTNSFPEEPVIIYESLFQHGKIYVREYADFVAYLTQDQQAQYGDGQKYRVEPLTEEELRQIKEPEFIQAKEAYLNEKYNNKTK